MNDETGKLVRELVTANDGFFSARIDTLLDDENPGRIEADLSRVLELVGR
jgi:hypothetical protein